MNRQKFIETSVVFGSGAALGTLPNMRRKGDFPKCDLGQTREHLSIIDFGGIQALKGLAFRRIEKGEHKPFPNCCFSPIADYETEYLPLRFTLSQGFTATVTPGETPIFFKALKIISIYRPLTMEEVHRLKCKAKVITPFFKA